jgi:DNA-binding transcriptional regulator YiaG
MKCSNKTCSRLRKPGKSKCFRCLLANAKWIAARRKSSKANAITDCRHASHSLEEKQQSLLPRTEGVTGMTLRQLRESVRMPRHALANRAGVSRFRLFEAETGLRELSPDEHAAVNAAFAAELARLVEVALTFQKAREIRLKEAD